MAKNNIPGVDLADFLSENPRRKQKFVNEIGKAFEDIGFVSLKNHFLSEDLSKELYKEVKAFFALPYEVKRKYEIEGLGGQRGYVSFGKEHAKGKKEGDLKEFWHFGQEPSADANLIEKYPKNLKVEELKDFYHTGMEAYRMLEKTGIYVLRALALHIGLDEHYFDHWASNGNSILRPIHYPPITEEPKGAERAGAHGDINLITLLMGASGGGLQVLRKDGIWIDAIPKADELVINVGDMLERLTKKKLGLEDLGGMVFSTGNDFDPGEYNKETEDETPPNKHQLLEAHFSNKGRGGKTVTCLLYTSPSPRDGLLSRMP